jgi:hypothetical protein
VILQALCNSLLDFGIGSIIGIGFGLLLLAISASQRRVKRLAEDAQQDINQRVRERTTPNELRSKR